MSYSDVTGLLPCFEEDYNTQLGTTETLDLWGGRESTAWQETATYISYVAFRIGFLLLPCRAGGGFYLKCDTDDRDNRTAAGHAYLMMPFSLID